MTDKELRILIISLMQGLRKIKHIPPKHGRLIYETRHRLRLLLDVDLNELLIDKENK